MLASIIAQIIKDGDLSQSKAKGGSVHEGNACDEDFSAFHSAHIFKDVSHTGPWADQAGIGQDREEFLELCSNAIKRQRFPD